MFSSWNMLYADIFGSWNKMGIVFFCVQLVVGWFFLREPYFMINLLFGKPLVFWFFFMKLVYWFFLYETRCILIFLNETSCKLILWPWNLLYVDFIFFVKLVVYWFYFTKEKLIYNNFLRYTKFCEEKT